MLKEILNSILCEMMYYEQIEHKRPVKIFVNDCLHNILKADCHFLYKPGYEFSLYGVDVQPFTDGKDEPEYYLSFEKGKFRKMYDAEPIVMKPSN